MSDTVPSPAERVRPLVRVRQVREFTPQPVERAQLDALLDVARWSGSSGNAQPGRFVLVTDEATLRAMAAASERQARPLFTAVAAIAIVMPGEVGREVGEAYDEGRAAERILIAAYAVGLSAGIAWIHPDGRPQVRELLGIPAGRMIRTTIALGHPTNAARLPKSPSGRARLPREQVVFEGRWPAEATPPARDEAPTE